MRIFINAAKSISQALVVCFCALCPSMSALEKSAIEEIFRARGLLDSDPAHTVQIKQILDSGIKDLFFVIAQKEGFQTLFIADKSGKVIIGVTPDFILTTDEVFEKHLNKQIENIQKANKNALDTKVLLVFEKYKHATFRIKGSNSKKTTYMVLDLNCPYCKQEVEKIDQYLAKSDLVILVAGMLGENSIKKAATFLTHAKEPKTNEQKIAYLKKAFTKDFQLDSSTSTDMSMNIALDLSSSGLRGVPHIIER